MYMFTFIFFILTFFSSVVAQDSTQTFLSLRNTGVESFQKAHPEYDGRGTIVLVLDTGVDMGVDGLTKTSTGEIKVIDVQDFTGQGDIQYFEAEIEEEDDTLYFINEDKNYKVKGVNKLKYKSDDENYFIGLLEESLWKNSGSKAYDINGNGSQTDKFYFVTFLAVDNDEEFWVVFLDTDADGDLSDEKPIRTYKEKLDSFVLPNESGLPKFTLALNILPKENMVSFVFDDGSHGTHCAGISTGNRIGENNLFGVAPGAKLIGLKLGNNNFSGGATVAESMKNSYLYADKISKETDKPCIINMSFGVGSEIEGHADIEIFLAELAKKNPYLYIATSNGNDGPGISSSGMPAASSAIFTTGAVLSQEVGNDLYGTTLNRDIILHFSSRGAEVAKPDVVAPGACVSTVPNFSKSDRFWGTSMASPYSAGVMAVLLGAFKVEYPDVKIPAQMLYKVLRESAKPIDGYSFVDQGHGLINIESAYLMLKSLIVKGEIKKFETYSVSSFAPNMPNNKAENLYIRDASFLSGTEKFTFKVKRNDFNKSNKFYRLFNLKSSADWLQIIQKKVHIRNNQSVKINVKLDKLILETPGLYNAMIKAKRADKSEMPEFDLMATVIVPFEFNSKNKYSLEFINEKIEPGMHKRYFLKIPVGTSNIKLTIDSDKNNFTSLRYYLYDPDGKSKLFSTLNAQSENGKKVKYIQDLEPGVYELIVLGQYTSSEQSIYDLGIEIDGINLLSKTLNQDDKVEIVNYFAKVNSFKLTGKLLGYQKEFNINMNGNKKHEIQFKLDVGESKKTFDISLSKEGFNKTTDFTIMIYDKNGKAKKKTGLSYKEESITIKRTTNDEIEEYTLIFIPGFANAPSFLNVDILESTYFNSSEEIVITNNYKSTLKMYPNINYTLDCEYKLPELNIPKGCEFFGEINFTSVKTKEVELTEKIIINK